VAKPSGNPFPTAEAVGYTLTALRAYFHLYFRRFTAPSSEGIICCQSYMYSLR